MAEVTEIVCVNLRCQKTVTLMKPVTEVLRGNYSTVLVFHHGVESQRCPHCGQGYVPYLQDLTGINFVWRSQQADVDAVVLRRQPTLTSKQG